MTHKTHLPNVAKTTKIVGQEGRQFKVQVLKDFEERGPSSLLLALRFSRSLLFFKFCTGFFVKLPFVGQLSCKACVT